MEVNLATSFDLVPHIPDHCVAVSESGIRRREDLRNLRDAGFDAFLVGEHLMTSRDVRVALETLLGKDE
jgi:indole-3-glycerol phosphate synthase